MTDPLKLATDLEPSTEPGAYCADKSHRHVALSVTEGEASLIAAALRLAAAMDSGEEEVGGYNWLPFRPGNQSTHLLAAYRKAKGA